VEIEQMADTEVAQQAETYQRDRGWVRDLTGVIVATCTPFDDQQRLDLPMVAPYIDFLVGHGVAGLMVGGTTSEFIAMTVEERIALVQETVRAVGGRVPVIAHVGHVVLTEALRMAEAAAAADAPAIAAIVPYFHTHSQAAIIDHISALARANRQMPLFVYNYPAATGNDLKVESFASLLGEPNIAGIKLSVATMADIEPFLQFMPDICVVSGNDAVWSDFTKQGGRTVVSGNAAANPDLMVALLDMYLSGGTSGLEILERRVADMRRRAHGGAPALLKDILRERGIDLGTSRVMSVTPRDLIGVV